MTDPWCCYIWCAMDPINIPPINVSTNIPAPWIRHGLLIPLFLGEIREIPRIFVCKIRELHDFWCRWNSENLLILVWLTQMNCGIQPFSVSFQVFHMFILFYPCYTTMIIIQFYPYYTTIWLYYIHFFNISTRSSQKNWNRQERTRETFQKLKEESSAKVRMASTKSGYDNCWYSLPYITLWFFNIAMDNGPFVDDSWWFTVPFKNCRFWWLR